ncbi:MAG: hypothetical protein WED07_16135 [Candidatus Freyarchaeum deiterrae]
MAFRPNGVTALAIIFIILAALGVIGAIFIEAVFIPQYQISNFVNLLSIPLIYSLSASLPPELAQILPITIAFIIGTIISSNMSFLSFMYIGVLISLIAVPLLIISAVGLFRIKQWGRYLGIIVGILFIIGGIISVIFILTGGILIVSAGIMIVVYLYSVVKEDFEMR